MPSEAPTILATSMGFNRARDPWQPSPVFRYAFELAGQPLRPKLCFIATGSGDSRDSIDNFYAAFADDDSIQASHLTLFDKPNVSDVRAHLRGQDVIWVDRGNVVNLLAVWRAHGLDELLSECWERGVVLGGESAGSLCWFEGGSTDSLGEVSGFDGGLGLLPYVNAVHYADRREQFHDMIESGDYSEGYATDAGAGLHFSGTKLVAAIADRNGAGAYRVTMGPDGVVAEESVEVLRLKR
ncbi:Type 1 glutamine amidotransferase-like domain-containing protein [Nocardia sp. NPDC050175]|uniref:Type 1 glutamine amidotransferase-like domain-containing protein n=1 Tax=Nocardia sp. NPDC050175 TaxID=3364317 RepID=UPI0037AC520D